MKKTILIVGSLVALGAGIYFTHNWYTKAQAKILADNALGLAKTARAMVDTATATAKAAVKVGGPIFNDGMVTKLITSDAEYTTISETQLEGTKKAMSYASSVQKVVGPGLGDVARGASNLLYGMYNNTRAEGKTHAVSLDIMKEYIKTHWNQ